MSEEISVGQLWLWSYEGGNTAWTKEKHLVFVLHHLGGEAYFCHATPVHTHEGVNEMLHVKGNPGCWYFRKERDGTFEQFTLISDVSFPDTTCS